MKMTKKLSAFFLALIMVFALSVPAFASETPTNAAYLPVAKNATLMLESDQPQTRVPNAIPIEVIAKIDGTGVKVNVGNIGVDGLDNVQVTATATGYSTPKIQSGYVPPVIGKTFDFYFPYIDCNTTYDVTIDVFDGSGTKHLTGTTSLVWSEENLKNAHWHRGSRPTRAASLEYHFDKHGKEVGATNLIEYLNFANMYRDQVLYDLNRGDTHDYYITDSPKPTPAKKYKSKSNQQFIYLANSDQFILSYGI